MIQQKKKRDRLLPDQKIAQICIIIQKEGVGNMPTYSHEDAMDLTDESLCAVQQNL
jgi:hypothetical protein